MIDYEGLGEEFKHHQCDEHATARMLHETLRKYLPDVDTREMDDDDKVKDMDTFGNLIDKLVTVNLKMWHNQEQLYAMRRMSTDEFRDRYGSHMDELHAVLRRCCDLNVQRSALMDEIDKYLKLALFSPQQHQTREQHKTY